MENGTPQNQHRTRNMIAGTVVAAAFLGGGAHELPNHTSEEVPVTASAPEVVYDVMPAQTTDTSPLSESVVHVDEIEQNTTVSTQTTEPEAILEDNPADEETPAKIDGDQVADDISAETATESPEEPKSDIGTALTIPEVPESPTPEPEPKVLTQDDIDAMLPVYTPPAEQPEPAPVNGDVEEPVKGGGDEDPVIEDPPKGGGETEPNIEVGIHPNVIKEFNDPEIQKTLVNGWLEYKPTKGGPGTPLVQYIEDPLLYSDSNGDILYWRDDNYPSGFKFIAIPTGEEASFNFYQVVSRTKSLSPFKKTKGEINKFSQENRAAYHDQNGEIFGGPGELPESTLSGQLNFGANGVTLDMGTDSDGSEIEVGIHPDVVKEFNNPEIQKKFVDGWMLYSRSGDSEVQYIDSPLIYTDINNNHIIYWRDDSMSSGFRFIPIRAGETAEFTVLRDSGATDENGFEMTNGIIVDYSEADRAAFTDENGVVFGGPDAKPDYEDSWKLVFGDNDPVLVNNTAVALGEPHIPPQENDDVEVAVGLPPVLPSQN